MKLFRYISAIALGAVALTSCTSDDNEDFSINTAAGVGVSVGQAEMYVNEAKGIFEVPIVVTGNPNGYVSVTVKITGTDNPNEDQAIADSHFYVTSTTVNIPKDAKTGNIEIRTQEFPQREDDKYFRVVIESAEGATVEGLNTTTVIIQDRLSSPIYKLSGPWTLEYNETGDPMTVTSNFVVISEATGECEFQAFCPALYSAMNLPVVYRENPKTGEWEMSLLLGETIAEVNFTGLGVCDVRIQDLTGKASGELLGTWNDDRTTVSFEGFQLGVYSEGSYKGYWSRITDCQFSPNN